MSITHDDMIAGQAVYSRRMLGIYDLLVLGLSCRCIWRCPASQMLAQYNACVSGNHLEVGVGTGYFLDKCRFPVENPRLVLADMNESCLAATAERVARYQPQTVRWNVFDPPPFGGSKFDSIGLNFVLHCLPGALAEKAVVFDHLKEVLNPGAVLFGSTILTQGVKRNFAARRLMGFYNRKRIFSNADDSLDELQRILSARFTQSTIEVSGCVAQFQARI